MSNRTWLFMVVLAMAVSFTAASFIPGLVMVLTHARMGRMQFMATIVFGIGIGMSSADLVYQFANAKSR